MKVRIVTYREAPFKWVCRILVTGVPRTTVVNGCPITRDHRSWYGMGVDAREAFEHARVSMRWSRS